MNKSIECQEEMKCKLEKLETVTKEEGLWNRNFVFLLQGQAISILGDNVYDTALRFWILVKTGSLALMGMIMAASILPKIFISPIAGTFVDRHDRRKILIISDTISGIAILIVGITAIMGFTKVWIILLTSLIVGTCNSFFNPAVNSSIPDIVPKAKLIKANSILSTISSTNDMAGYAFGGFLVQLIGAPLLFLLNGISFLYSAINGCFMKIPKLEAPCERLDFIEDMKYGINFVKNSKGLKYLFVTIIFLNFCGSMSMTLTLPLFKAQKELGVGMYGLAMAINTLGMLVGFIILSIINIKKELRFYFFIASGIIVSITMIIYALFVNIILILILFFIDGFALAVMGTLIQSSIQNFVPTNMRSRVFGFKNMLYSALMPLGMVLAGLIGEIVSVNKIIAADYIVFLVLFIYLSLLTSVKELINM